MFIWLYNTFLCLKFCRAELFLHAVFDTTPVYWRNIAKVILIPLP
ncbi:hypothetical protein PRABACTJOHN_00879 [Parabacteroides johnsonii DSM 18315]|uniref:Uncharacterized protein n=1 Tax=Parabacteroides johnsonii DSM 18315 TaxID=537006 RepID=B7B782_9BACT|nr:hypothetical protein PRABACTJOHN_00879 [Parabacteroides johnsonii DSM 18315]